MLQIIGLVFDKYGPAILDKIPGPEEVLHKITGMPGPEEALHKITDFIVALIAQGGLTATVIGLMTRPLLPAIDAIMAEAAANLA